MDDKKKKLKCVSPITWLNKTNIFISLHIFSSKSIFIKNIYSQLFKYLVSTIKKMSILLKTTSYIVVRSR